MHEYEVEKKMKKVKNVILYSRIGSDKYGTHGLDSQEQMLFDFAEKNKLSVVDAVREISDGYLGKYSRPGLLYAMETSRLDVKHCVVLVTDIDRLSKRAGYIANLIGDNRATFIAAKHGVYYKTMPMQFTAAINEETYRSRCERDGVDMVRDTLEGRIRFAKHMKPELQRMFDSGMSLDDLCSFFGVGRRAFLPNIDGWWSWTRAQIEDVMNLG